MTALGDRIEGWVNRVAELWKDRLRGWMISWVFSGIVDALEDMTPEQAQSLQGLTKQFIDDPNTPLELKAFLEQMPKRGSPALIVAAVVFGILMVVPMVTGAFQSLGNLWMYTQDRKLRTFRLDPTAITRIWLRDKPEYEKLWDDLRDQGWSDERIKVAQELAHIIPPLADMVRFADFGSFDPVVIEKWREFYDAPDWIKKPMALLGVVGDWANKYWFSHWRQPGRFELGEMHRRGLIDDEIVKLSYLTQGFSSFWQGKLLELVKETWTRVDIRRMWDMRTISEKELRKAYKAQGYYDEWLDGMVLWTKVYVAFPDLIMRWKNGWISLDDVRAELTGLGMPPDRVEEMIETKMKAAQPERTSRERDLTKADIIKGVKREIITWSQGIELLQDLGFSEDEADYILTISIAAEAGSPETFEEFRDLTQKWRKAVGKEAKPVTEELKAAAAEVIRLTKDIEVLKESIEAEERTLIQEEVLPAEATAKRDELRVTLHRAEAELARAQTDYKSLLAEWRHGG